MKLRERLIDAIAKGTVPPETPLDSANTDSPPLLYGPSESLAYVLHGLLPAFGSVTRILREVQKSMPPGAWWSGLPWGSARVAGGGGAVVASSSLSS